MSIESVGSLQKILKNYDAEGWSKSANLETVTAADLQLDGVQGGNGPQNKKSFTEMLASSIGQVNELQGEANKAVQKLVSGESKNIHETMLAVEQAEIAFKTMNQVRQKVIDAYKEVMRMQV